MTRLFTHQLLATFLLIVAAALLNTSSAADMTAEEVRQGYIKHATMAQLYR